MIDFLCRGGFHREMLLEKTLPSVSIQARSVALSVLGVLFFAGLTAVSAYVRIPIPGSPIPITLQTLIVVLAGYFMGPWKGATSQATLLAAGAFGLPVFAQAGGVFGPTGGYLVGFVLCAFVTGWLKKSNRLDSFLSTSIWLAIASLFVFLPGVIWLQQFSQLSWGTTLALGFYPFLLGDLIKTLMAASFIWAHKKIA